MDLRNNQDDRPYRVNRAEYGVSQRRDTWEDETLSTQGYYREVLRNMTEQRWFPLAAVTMGVVVFGSLIAFAYRQGAHTSANATTPLIQAENNSYKERPQDPGGMDVPFQDAIVFDQLDKTKTANAGEKVENLLPPPEQPVADPVKEVADASQTSNQASSETAPPSAPREDAEDKSVIADATTNNTDSIADKIAATEAAMKNKATDTTTQTEEKVAKASETVKDETQKTVAAVEKKVETKTETVAAKTIPAKATTTTTASTNTTKATALNNVAPAAPTPAASNVASSGNAKVQLGAFKDEAAARAAWAQFQKQYAPHLNGVTPNYARADLGAKGVFYRVQGVNLSQAKAKTICQSINSIKSGSCLIPQ
jgi:DNA polymerase III gamma/tau subunit